MIYMIFRMSIQNLTTIGPVVSEITCILKMDTDTRQTDRQEVMKRQENIKVAIRPMDLIPTILP